MNLWTVRQSYSAAVCTTLQDDMTVRSTLGEYTSSLNLRPEVREKRLSLENSVEQCRKICEEAQTILQGRLSSLQEALPRLSTEFRGTNTNLSNPGDNSDSSSCDTIDSAEVDHTPSNPVSLQLATGKTSAPLLRAAGTYCEGCMSSLLSTSKSGCSTDDGNSQDSTREENKVIDTPGLMSSPERRDSTKGAEANSSPCQLHPLDLVWDTGSCVPNGLRAHALRALALHTDTKGELGACQGRTCGGLADLRGLSSGILSCHHFGCSFGTLGTNCDICDNEERAITERNEIPAEISKLCGSIMKVLEPSFDKIGGAMVSHSEGKEVHEDGQLKTRLASAKLLATWLWEEVEVIVGHDVDCLTSHVKERGHLGILLESLQVLLLQIANLAIGLLQSTCQDECLVKDLRVQLLQLKGSPNSTQSVQRKDTLQQEQQVDISSTATQEVRTSSLSCSLFILKSCWPFDALMCQVWVEGAPIAVTFYRTVGPAALTVYRAQKRRPKHNVGVWA